MVITHYDLFAGIGGFSLALEEVFSDEPIRHIFCEWERFPTSVLKRHWPNGEYWGDIAELVTNTERPGRQGQRVETKRQHGLSNRTWGNQEQSFTIVTGGFPCQPFSHAGRRKGTADDRYQWPNMYEVIRNVKPEWVIAENVRGLVTWNDGLVLETVCSDLEAEGYEVQPFIIPAVAVGAPHRRDRVWIIGKRTQDATDATDTKHNGSLRAEEAGKHSSSQSEVTPRAKLPEHELEGAGGLRQEKPGRNTTDANADTGRKRRQSGSSESIRPSRQESERQNRQYPDWSRNWQEVAFATCDDSVDDGLPRLVDGVPYSRAKWRKDSLKAYGNGIVPEVAMNIMQAIKETYEQYSTSQFSGK